MDLKEIVRSCESIEISIIKQKEPDKYLCVVGDGEYTTEPMDYDSALRFVEDYFHVLRGEK